MAGILDSILQYAGRSGKSVNPGQRMFPADKRPTLDNLGETKQGRKREAQLQLAPVMEAISLLSPFSVTAAAATYSPEAEAAIRPGGRSDLNMFHNLGGSLDNIMRLLTGRKSITSPSVGIASNRINSFSDTPTLIFNPSSGRLDPGMAKANQLFNRDAYTFRSRSPVETPKDVRMSGADVRYTEGGGPMDLGHFAGIEASPKFANFKDYERSPFGAAVLTSNKDKVVNNSKVLEDAVIEWKRSAFPNTRYTSSVISAELRQAAKSGDEKAKQLLDYAKSLPSEYAELKVVGELPLNQNTVSALIFPEHWDGREVARLSSKITDKSGIRAGKPGELMPAEEGKRYSDLIDLIHETVQKESRSDKLSPIYDRLPKEIQSRIHPDYVDSAIDASSEAKAKRMITLGVAYHPQFASDVASILTAKDSDEVINMFTQGK